MKKFLIAGVTAAALSGAPALAADMAVKAPPPAPLAAPTWSGFYIDGDIGWLKNSDTWYYNAVGLLVSYPQFSVSSTNGVWGDHVGYQQQFSWLVVGAEVGAFESFKNSFALSAATFPGFVPPCGNAVGSTCGVSVGAVYTAGGKLGVVRQDWLLYGVGGAAFSNNIGSRIFAPGGAPIDYSSTQTARGYYAGGGVDFMAYKDKLFAIIVGAEYEHIDLGTIQTFSSLNGFGPVIAGAQRVLGAKEDMVLGKITVKFNPFGF